MNDSGVAGQTAETRPIEARTGAVPSRPRIGSAERAFPGGMRGHVGFVHRFSPLRWSTGVQTLASASTAQDLVALRLNLAQCRASRGRRFVILRAGDAVTRFLAPRLITTVVVVAAVWAALVAFA